jgi:DNA adenine methylase
MILYMSLQTFCCLLILKFPLIDRLMKNEQTGIAPFLKWAGGKRWLVESHLELIPNNFNRYFEPFLGSGAVFFSLNPKSGVISDTNRELIEAYIAIKRNYQLVVRHLRTHHRNHSNKHYYETRQSQPRSIFTKAAKFIYLNKTCWNGLYRVNLNGKFNVPVGTKTNVVFGVENYPAIAEVLKNTEIILSDFEPIIDRAGFNDLVFVDPPYTVKHKHNGFIKYNEKLFSWADQVRLKECLKRARQRGVIIISTNADHESIRELYQQDFKIRQLSRRSSIAGDSNYRGKCDELMIVN